MTKKFLLIEGDASEQVHVTQYVETDLLRRFNAPFLFMVRQFVETADVGSYAIVGNNYYVVVRVK